MDTTKKVSPADLAERTLRQIERLRNASALRRRLTPGSPQYVLALDAEEELARSLWYEVDRGRRRSGRSA